MKEFEKIENGLCFILSNSIYCEDVLYKCFYWYGGEFDVNIATEGNNFKITLLSKLDIGNGHDALLKKIQQDLIDFKLRDIVSKETKNIRELLTAKAFAHFESGEFPSTEVSDPVGFNPSEF